MTWSRFWPATCSLWAVVTVAAVLAGVEGPARTVLVFAFMLACPGMAVVGLLGLGSRLLQMVMGVALSMLIGVVVAQVLTYTVWEPVVGLVALAGITLLASVVGYRYDALGDAGVRRAAQEGGRRWDS